MDTINWANYTYDEFELFCSALLTFEFGKSYQPYSAPGKDGGIDGAFNGGYQQKTGKWRFQFKFHQVARSQGVNSLKSQVKKEVEKLGDEDFFVLLTNIELLPQEHDALISTFNEEINGTGKQCSCLVWDGAKLYNLYLQYPLLSLWLNEGFRTSQIQDYRNVFRKNLNASELDPGSFSNVFISNSVALDKLSEFLNSTHTMGLVIGEAGIGKTRLVVEFFKKRIDQMEDWIPLVLLNRHIDFDKIKKALTSNFKYIILIDDAHTYSPEVIADMKAIAESLEGNIKIILTTRTLEAFNSLTLIKEYEASKFPQINVDALSRADTESLFKHYITSQHYLHFINEMVQLSYGKPIMIVSMLNAMRANIPINEIKDDDFLKSYVKNYFETYIDAVSKSTNISKSTLQRFLKTVALIEPFNFSDADLNSKIAKIHDINPKDVSEALKLLIDKGFVNGRYEQSIKPDYYSDILLSEIDYNDVVTYISDFNLQLDNIIINLSSVDEINSSKNEVLKKILTIYVDLISSSEDIAVIKKVLSTVLSISFIQPEIAKSAVTIFIKSFSGDSPLYLDYLENEKYNYQSGDEPISRIVAILSNLYSNPSNLDFVISSALSLYSRTADKKIANIFSFTKKDVLDSFSVKRQLYVISEYTKRSKKYTRDELDFVLLCISAFLNLDFTLTEWSKIKRDALNITTYYVPSNSPVKKMRKAVIDLLLLLYGLPNASELKSEILKKILDVPRGIFATTRNKTSYKNDVEIKLVLEYLSSVADTFSIIDQKEVLDKLYWFGKWGMPQSLMPLAEQVKDALKPKNLTERLSQLFSKAENSVLEMQNVDNYVAEKVEEFIDIASEGELAESIISFLEPQQYPPHYYWAFQNKLEMNYPSYAKVLNQIMYDRSLALYHLYGYRILSTLYFQHHDVDYYWQWVKKLQQLKTVEADNVLLSIYGQRVPYMTPLTAKDMDVIVKVFDKKKKENNFILSTALQCIFAVDSEKAMEYSREYLYRASQREAGMFFIRLSDNELVTEDQMADLVLNDTIRFALSYEFERCLNLVLKSQGSDKVFDYFIKRFLYKKQIVITRKTLSDYEFVPGHRHSHLFDQCEPEIRLEMFLKSINWYLIEDSDGGHLYYAKDLLEYLQPSEALNNDIVLFYEDKISQLQDNGEQLLRLAETLGIFHVKDTTLLDIVTRIYDLGYEFINDETDLYQKIRSQCYMAIITMGVKSGAADEPFQVDLDLRDLLQYYIKNQPDYHRVRQFLVEVLKSVNNDIDRSIDRENSTW